MKDVGVDGVSGVSNLVKTSEIYPVVYVCISCNQGYRHRIKCPVHGNSLVPMSYKAFIDFKNGGNAEERRILNGAQAGAVEFTPTS